MEIDFGCIGMRAFRIRHTQVWDAWGDSPERIFRQISCFKGVLNLSHPFWSLTSRRRYAVKCSFRSIFSVTQKMRSILQFNVLYDVRKHSQTHYINIVKLWPLQCMVKPQLFDCWLFGRYDGGNDNSTIPYEIFNFERNSYSHSEKYRLFLHFNQCDFYNSITVASFGGHKRPSMGVSASSCCRRGWCEFLNLRHR